MRKYLELFKEGFPSDIDIKTSIENKPYVGYSLTGGGAVYTVVPEPVIDDPWVTFTAEEDNSSFGLAGLSPYQTLEYSMDTTTWNAFDITDITTSIPLNNGDKVYIRGILNSDNTDYYTQFKMSGKIAASGNCNAIWNYQDLNAPLKACCGYCMFEDCSSLTTAPELPATTLAEGCYSHMFYGCSSLTTAPVLPATTLVGYCYKYMFYKCKLINYIKCLATDISANSCTSDWVYRVASTGTFVKHPSMVDSGRNWYWDTGKNGIPSGWTVVDAEL